MDLAMLPATIPIEVICAGVPGPGTFWLRGLVATRVVVRRAPHPVPILPAHRCFGVGCASRAGRGDRGGLPDPRAHRLWRCG